MRIKSGVWYWLAVASGAVGMLYALGFAGSIEALGVISDTDFITAMVLLLLALFFARLGDHAAEREVQRRKYIDRRHARPEEPEGRMNAKKPVGAGTPASLQRDDGLNAHHPEE